MDKLIAGFSNQLKDALNIAEKYNFKISNDSKIDNILIVGLGGSGIGATIIQNFTFDKSSIPVVVSKAYTLPHFVNENTLVIACSYSGNTEETVYSLKDAIKLGAQIVTITSGGKIQAIAEEKGYDCILIPGGFPPRSCFGYSFVQLLRVFQHFNIIDDFYTSVKSSIVLIEKEEEQIKSTAQEIAKAMFDKTPIIYIENNMEGVAIRWRQQFNENGKMLCWHNVIPEMNHNELVGWRDNDDSRAVFFLRSNTDYPRSVKRMDLNKNTIAQYTTSIFDIESKGKCYLENVIYLVHLGDWISWYLSEERHFDATEVGVIDRLKSALTD